MSACVCVYVCVRLCFQGVWSMEGQQPGSGEAGQSWWQRRPGSAPRSRLHAHHPPAGEAANPPDDYREPHQEIWHPPPPLCHSGRYSRVRGASKRAWFTQLLMWFLFFFPFSTWGTNFTVCCFINSKAYNNFSGSVFFGSQITSNRSGLVYEKQIGEGSERRIYYFCFAVKIARFPKWFVQNRVNAIGLSFLSFIHCCP